jgi:hypothetical protein
MKHNDEIAWAINRREQEERASEMFYLPGFEKIHPMKLLELFASYGAIHYSLFMDLQHHHKIWVTKTALRALSKMGWILGCFDFAWSITEEGRAKVAEINKESS